MAKRQTERVMNPHSRPVDLGGGRMLAPGEHADVAADERVARLLERGTLRRRRSHTASQHATVEPEPAGDQEVDQ